ncbi:MAG: hypothetical protein C4319_05630 [Acidimicrobiia bacterium]
MVLVLISILVVAAVVAAQLVFSERRDFAIYGSILDFNRRLANIALLRTAPLAMGISTANQWEEASIVGHPPPTVRLIGPDGRPIEPPPEAKGYGYGTSSIREPRTRYRGDTGAYAEGSLNDAGYKSRPTSTAAMVPSRPDLQPAVHVGEVARNSAGSYSARRRRKAVFQTLLAAFTVTFVIGILPGLKAVLLLSLLCGALLIAYVSVLRKLKLQSKILSDASRQGVSSLSRTLG